MNKPKKVVFLTGTRADFGKMKPLIDKIENSDLFENYVFVTGMHTLSRYGSTYREILKNKYKNIFIYLNQTNTTDMDMVLANTIVGFGNFIKEIKPEMIIIHGDRVESLAGAIVGSLNNILVCHVEGGEVSGTIDGSIRHSISKLSHIHFVSNQEAKNRLAQMGEEPETVFIIGSPDIDVMLSGNLPTLQEAKERYGIDFSEYGIFIFHPVTTHLDTLETEIRSIVSALIRSGRQYIVVYPNNDHGSNIIIDELRKLEKNNHFRIFPSLRFEHFVVLLKNASFIIGNSSAGVREAEVFGVPSINIGNRQNNRTQNVNIINVEARTEEIISSIERVSTMRFSPISNFGNGNSSELFYKIITEEDVWNIPIQKVFIDNGM